MHAKGYTTATVYRTQMCGGGTSYDVYFRKADKPSYPLHGLTRATIVLRGGVEYFEVVDAIDPKVRWTQSAGWEKYDSHLKLAKRAKRLACRIAKRAYPELSTLRTLPTLWADWTLPSDVRQVRVRLTLPE